MLPAKPKFKLASFIPLLFLGLIFFIVYAAYQQKFLYKKKASERTTTSQREKPAYVPGEILLITKNTLPSFSRNAASRQITDTSALPQLLREFKEKNQLREIRPLGNLKSTFRLSLVQYDQQKDIYGNIESLLKDPNVVSASPNYIYSTFGIPNDPLFSQQWSLQQGSNIDIDAPEGWDLANGSSFSTVAVIDTGIFYQHPDLTNKIFFNSGEYGQGKENNGVDDDQNGFIDDYQGWSFTDDSNDANDLIGHGTHVAGIIGASTNNNLGVAGINWQSKILPVRVCQSDGCTCSNIIEGISYATQFAQVINMSLGGYLVCTGMEEVINNAVSQGVITVASAGNDSSSSKVYPGSFSAVVAVAATSKDDFKASFSNYGDWVDIAAPGVDILSTLPLRAYLSASCNDNDSDYYGVCSGTSMAAPVVSGVVSVLKSARPGLPVDELVEYLKSAVDDMSKEVSYGGQLGKGRVNLHKALNTRFALNITYPFRRKVVNGTTLDIQGTALSEGSQFNYEISYSQDNQNWHTDVIYPGGVSNQPVNNGLLASIPMQKFKDKAQNYLKLKVSSSFGTEEYVSTFKYNSDIPVFSLGEQNQVDNAPVPGSAMNSHGVLDKSNQLHVVYTQREQVDSLLTNHQLIYRVSQDNGKSFEGEQIIAPNVGHLYDYPVLATQNDNLYLAYELWENKDKTHPKIVFNQTPTNQVSFAHQITLDLGDVQVINQQGYFLNLQMAVDSLGRIYIVYQGQTPADISNNTVGIYLLTSDDGVVFSPNKRIFTAGINVSYLRPPSPRIALDSQDQLYLVWINTDSVTDSSHVYFSKSTNKGATFSDRKIVRDVVTPMQKNPQILFSNNKLYVGWEDWEESNTPIMNLNIVRSENFGETFSQAVDASSGYLDALGAMYWNLEAGTDGEIYVSWGPRSEQKRLYFTKSNDNGESYLLPVAIDSKNNGYIWFNKLVPGSKNDFYSLYDSFTNTNGYSSHVYAVRSSFRESFSFQAGWNWLSLRAKPVDNRTEVIFASALGKILLIAGETTAFSPQLDPVFNSLKTIEAGKLYMVNATEPTTFSLGATELPTNTPLVLHKGWNWIGYYPNFPMSVTDALLALNGKYQLVHGETGSYRPGSEGNTLSVMEPNKGYLIYMNEPVVFSYPISSSRVSSYKSSECILPKTTLFSQLVVKESVVARETTQKTPRDIVLEAINTSGEVFGCTNYSLGKVSALRLYGQQKVGDKTISGFKDQELVLIRLRDKTTGKVLSQQSSNLKFSADLQYHQVAVPSLLPVATIILPPIKITPPFVTKFLCPKGQTKPFYKKTGTSCLPVNSCGLSNCVPGKTR